MRWTPSGRAIGEKDIIVGGVSLEEQENNVGWRIDYVASSRCIKVG